MRFSHLTIATSFVAAAIAIAASPQRAAAVLVDFDSNSDMNDFIQFGNTVRAPNPAIGGVAGGVETSLSGTVSDSGLIYTGQSFAPSPLQTQIFFLTGNNTLSTSSFMRLGFAGHFFTTFSVSPNATYFWVEAKGSSLSLNSKVAGVTTTPLNATTPLLAPNTWYRLSLTLAPAGGADFNGSIEMQDYGPLGTTPGSVLFTGGALLNNPTAAADPTWYAGFGQPWLTTRFSDDFSVAAIPESGAALMLAAVSGLGVVMAVPRFRRGLGNRCCRAA